MKENRRKKGSVLKGIINLMAAILAFLMGASYLKVEENTPGILMILAGVTFLLYGGASIFSAQYFGRKDKDGVKRTLDLVFLYVTLFSLFFGAVTPSPPTIRESTMLSPEVMSSCRVTGRAK